MNEIPSSWIRTELENIAADTDYPIGDGDHGQIKPSDYKTEGIPYIRVGDIGWGSFTKDKMVYISKSTHLNNQKSKLVPGDILIAKTGATIGKCCIVPNEIAEANTTSSVGKVTINKKMTFPKWILYYFLTRELYDYLWSISERTAQPGFNNRDLKKFIIPLAPIKEQERILKKLDKLLTQVDESKRRLEKIPVVIKRFRQSVLNAAVTGELTKDWREKNFDTENGEQLYEKIQNHIDEWYQKESQIALKQGKRKPKNQRSNPKARYIVEELSGIPSNWKYSRLEDLCYLVSDGTHKTPIYLSEGKKFLSVKNVRPFRIFDTDIKYISNEEYDFINARCNPEKGDILYTKVGATYGYAAKVNLDYPFSIFVSLALIKPVKEFFTSDYCELVMNSELVFQQARSRISGIGTPDLHLIEIRDFRIPLPPQKEQAEIVKRVESLFKKSDEIEERYKKAKAYIDKLTQSILAKAFRGELVPQDPNDEPAEKLLERVRDEKEKLGSTKRKIKKQFEE